VRAALAQELSGIGSVKVGELPDLLLEKPRHQRDVMSHPAAAIYSGAGGWFSVVVGVPAGAVMPTAQQVVQGERSNGHADAAAFPPGRAGGILTCFSYPGQNGRPVKCSWIDQVTAGQVLFDGVYASNLADAAAKTMHLRDAIEQ